MCEKEPARNAATNILHEQLALAIVTIYQKSRWINKFTNNSLRSRGFRRRTFAYIPTPLWIQSK
jgi:hypothetical protein